MLYAHPQVLDVAVFGIPDDEWGERVHAIVQAKAGETIDLDELRAFAEPRLAQLQAAARRTSSATSCRAPTPASCSKRVLRDEYWQGRTPRYEHRSHAVDRRADPLRSRVEGSCSRSYGVPVLDERTAADADGAVAAADAIGYPGRGEAVRRRDRAQDRARPRAARARATPPRCAPRRPSCSPRRRPTTARSSCSSRRWSRGTRELIAGLVRDPQFGPCVMLGVGGVLAEALGDVAFRARAARPSTTPTTCIDDLATQKLLGPFRGEPAVDRAALRATLVGLSRLADGPTRRRVGRPQPAHRRRRQAGRRRRARRARPTDASDRRSTDDVRPCRDRDPTRGSRRCSSRGA